MINKRIERFNKKIQPHLLKKFKINELALVSNEHYVGNINTFQPKYQGPWKILKRGYQKNTYIIQNVQYPDYKVYVNIRRLKKFNTTLQKK